VLLRSPARYHRDMRRRILFVALGVAVVVGAGVALASIPDADGTIHGCRSLRTGALRVIGSRAHCREGERRLDWNVRGPQGPPGPQGEPGPDLTSFDALAGLSCTVGATTGEIAIAYDPDTGDAQIRCVLPSAPPGEIRINEFSTGVEGALSDEFVEIVNAGTELTDISGYKLVYRSAAGTTDVALATFPEGTTLAPGAFYLFGGSAYAGIHPTNQSFAPSLASSGGGIGLRDPDGGLADTVAWGTATNAFVEATAAPAPPTAPAPGKSDGRHPDGHDTNDNGADFTVIETPSPGSPNL
jgi:hypothetical protein